jgi:hypothetical protein
MGYLCPVCGYSGLYEIPRTKDGGGSYEICPSCGFQFGVSDDDRHITHAQWRKTWINNGMLWRSNATPPPPHWDPKRQLQNLPGINPC